MKARIDSMYFDSISGKNIISFSVDTLAGMDDFVGKDLSIEIKKFSKKRSLDANAYFHVLLGKMANAVGCSKPYMKNMLLQRYGNREIDEATGELQSVLALDSLHLEQREDLHCMPVGYRDEYTIYGVYQPSHTMNSEEFSYLLEGTINEANELGIETATPEEVAQMKALMKENE